MSDRKCCYCGTTEEELRPYGPNGAWLCFPCMKADPSRENEAKNQLGLRLGACGDVAVIGGEEGPLPPVPGINFPEGKT